jgi:asparagine synthase (glutamine-hydrolysing)
MCGIGGILYLDGRRVEKYLIQRMTSAMAHRGPDAEGTFLDDELAFGHRRLSIIDLSEAANQPFSDVSGRYTIIFNGEIYNYAEIKAQIDSYPFRTHSDTEVLLAGYIKWGTDSLFRLRGMYTFAIWDRKERELFIARDRLGVKPLYYYQDEKQFVFASEVRAVLTAGDIERRVNPESLANYFHFQSIGFPYSPIKGVHQMEAGSWMKIKNRNIQSHVYWDPAKKNFDFEYSNKREVENKVKELMVQSVKRRLVSDVPVGAFLSGGIDSSAIVGLMTEAGDLSPNTFNISFDESEFDESKYANIIAKKFNTRHTQISMKPEVMLEQLTNALDAMDTPSGDGINTYVVSKAIHDKGIRVALSGIGGDELFAGYPIFLNYIRLQQKRWIWDSPVMVRNLVGHLIGKSERKDRIRQMLKFSSPGIENVYSVLRQIISPAALKKLTNLDGCGAQSLFTQLVAKKEDFIKLPFYSQVTAAEYLGYSQQTLLKDTDQMSMANSLEIREPFFDQDLIEFVMSVPDHFKVPHYPKSLLVESLKPLLPDEIVHREKRGFLFPWDKWMKKDLRSFCDKQIGQMAQRDFIRGDRLQFTWKSFLSGDKNIRWMEIWLFVVLNYWMEKNQIQ